MTSIIYGAFFKDNQLIASGVSLKHFGYFQQNTINEFCRFISREIAKRTPRGVFETIRDPNHYLEYSLGFDIKSSSNKIIEQLHQYQVVVFTPSWSDITVVFITSVEYPSKTLYKVFLLLLKDFNPTNTNFLQENIDKYQDPTTIDKIAQIQTDLKDVKEIMIKNVEQIFENGEKLEDLLKKSEDLSNNSKIFLKKTKKINRCLCNIL